MLLLLSNGLLLYIYYVVTEPLRPPLYGILRPMAGIIVGIFGTFSDSSPAFRWIVSHNKQPSSSPLKSSLANQPANDETFFL